jgi:hypothetical protein
MASNGSQAIVVAGEVKSSLPAPQLDAIDTQTKAVGVIIPPHNIRQVVDKTADFVAQNGVVPTTQHSMASSGEVGKAPY